MIIAPVIFCVRRDGHRRHGKHEGGGPYRRGRAALLEIVSVRIALIIGLIIASTLCSLAPDERRSGNAGCAGGGRLCRTSQVRAGHYCSS